MRPGRPIPTVAAAKPAAAGKSGQHRKRRLANPGSRPGARPNDATGNRAEKPDQRQMKRRSGRPGTRAARVPGWRNQNAATRTRIPTGPDSATMCRPSCCAPRACRPRRKKRSVRCFGPPVGPISACCLIRPRDPIHAFPRRPCAHPPCARPPWLAAPRHRRVRPRPSSHRHRPSPPRAGASRTSAPVCPCRNR